MTQLIAGVLALQPDSLFAKAYNEGVSRSQYWHLVLEDSLNLIAKLPPLAAAIYRRSFKHAAPIEADPSLDYAANFAHMLGFNSPGFHDLMRLYVTIHV